MVNSNETHLRGVDLEGADQSDAVDHAEAVKNRKPDAELHLDGEKDSLYDDGLDIGDDSETLADTKGNVNRG